MCGDRRNNGRTESETLREKKEMEIVSVCMYGIKEGERITWNSEAQEQVNVMSTT